MDVAPFAGVEPPDSTLLGALLTKLAPMLRTDDESRRIARDFNRHLFFLFLESAQEPLTHIGSIFIGFTGCVNRCGLAACAFLGANEPLDPWGCRHPPS